MLSYQTKQRKVPHSQKVYCTIYDYLAILEFLFSAPDFLGFILWFGVESQK
jgi:hypothetical protein